MRESLDVSNIINWPSSTQPIVSVRNLFVNNSIDNIWVYDPIWHLYFSTVSVKTTTVDISSHWDLCTFIAHWHVVLLFNGFVTVLRCIIQVDVLPRKIKWVPYLFWSDFNIMIFVTKVLWTDPFRTPSLNQWSLTECQHKRMYREKWSNYLFYSEKCPLFYTSPHPYIILSRLQQDSERERGESRCWLKLTYKFLLVSKRSNFATRS